jgi:hypothetical protein
MAIHSLTIDRFSAPQRMTCPSDALRPGIVDRSTED